MITSTILYFEKGNKVPEGERQREREVDSATKKYTTNYNTSEPVPLRGSHCPLKVPLDSGNGILNLVHQVVDDPRGTVFGCSNYCVTRSIEGRVP